MAASTSSPSSGRDTRERSKSSAFFSDDEVKAAINAIAATTNLSILAGSGVSSDAGLPLWDDLLLRLMTDGTQLPPDVAAEAQAVETSLGQASLIEAAYADDAVAFANAVARALDSTHTHGDQHPLLGEQGGPGETAQAIASICVHAASGKAPKFLLTTNYDLLLEFALVRAQKAKSETADVSPVTAVRLTTGTHDSSPAVGRWRVHHLHGWVPTPTAAAETIGVPSTMDQSLAEDGNRLVLSETGYYPADREASTWQDDLLGEVLGPESTLLIVGTGLADPALVRHIYRTRPPSGERTRAYAILLRPNPIRSLTAEDQTRRVAYEAAARARWKAVGVEVLFADFRFQVAQFCSEVAYRRSPEYAAKRPKRRGNAAPRRYGARLDAWFRGAYAKEGLINAEQLPDELDEGEASKRFQNAQRQLSQTLRELIEDLRSEFTELETDHLGLHLWCRTPRRLYIGEASSLLAEYGGVCALGMVGASDRSWTDPESIDTRELHSDGDRIAIRAFTQQAVGVASVDMASWDQLVAVPISLVADDTPARRLPVGVLSLNARSMSPGTPAGLSTIPADPARFVSLTATLARMGSNLLAPRKTDT